MIAKLTSLVLFISGCSTSAPEKLPAERTKSPVAVPLSREQAEEEANARDPVVVALETEHAKLVAAATEHLKAVDVAQDDHDRTALLARLDELIKARRILFERTQATRLAGEHRHAYDRFMVIESDLGDLEPKLKEAHDTVARAQTEADRASATAKLRQLQQEQAEMKARIKAAKAKKR